MTPERIQRKRTKGWRKPLNTVCVDRSTKWGNPFVWRAGSIYLNCKHRRKLLDPWVYYCEHKDPDYVVYLYELLYRVKKYNNPDLQYWADRMKQNDLSELRGKNLACFCSLKEPCHADWLLKIANKEFLIKNINPN